VAPTIVAGSGARRAARKSLYFDASIADTFIKKSPGGRMKRRHANHCRRGSNLRLLLYPGKSSPGGPAKWAGSAVPKGR